MPSYSDVISTIALIAALGSLMVSVYIAFHDRPRLKVIGRFIPPSKYGPARIALTFVNKGRRPVILRLLGGSCQDGKSSAQFIEHDKGGLRLGEHERHEYYLEKDDMVIYDPEHVAHLYVRLWVEDSLGFRHPVPNSKTLLKQLWS